jgi:NAD(P)H-quinone oxidoreductase subunit 5
MKPQPIDSIYGLGVIFVCLLWILFNAKSASRLRSTEAWKTLYVSSLNGSQPHPATVTANRTSYQF